MAIATTRRATSTSWAPLAIAAAYLAWGIDNNLTRKLSAADPLQITQAICFILALRHLGAARTGAYFSTTPFIGAAGAVMLLGEPVMAQLLIASALMVVGVGCI